MSAYVVSEETLNDVVVLTSKVFGIELKESNSEMLNDLLNKANRINIESVDFRYSEETGEIDEMTFSDFDNDETIEQLIKSFKCWNYQSCEKESVEYLMISSAVIGWIVSMYPTIQKTQAYEDAKWGRE